MRHYKMQLVETLGKILQSTGGVAFVVPNGDYSKASLLTSAGAAASNPVALNRGLIEFYTADTVESVDLYVQAPGGQFVTAINVKPSGNNELFVNTQTRNHLYRIPVYGSDYTAASENDLGIDLPAAAILLPDVGLNVTTAQAKTMDVGLLSSESGGDADGIMVAIPFTTTGVVAAKSASTATRGALIGAGTLDRGASTDVQTAKSLSITPQSGTTTAKGLILLPVLLCAA